MKDVFILLCLVPDVPTVYCYKQIIMKFMKFQLDLRSRAKNSWIKGTKKQAVIFK
jgi:hypothetical protein